VTGSEAHTALGAISADMVFKLATYLALMGWLVLAAAPLRRDVAVSVARWAVAILCGAYAAMLVRALGGGGGTAFAQMGTLDGVVALMKSREALLIGWVHYLAFDLFTGAWIVGDAPRSNVPHWLVLPCLFLTLMAGPVGLLVYLLIRSIRQPRR